MSSASFEDFKRLLEVNVQGTFLVTSQVLAKMRLQEPKQLHPTQPKRGVSRGTVVNMASLLSYMVLPSMVQYVTSKHAVMGISRTAGELMNSKYDLSKHVSANVRLLLSS